MSNAIETRMSENVAAPSRIPGRFAGDPAIRPAIAGHSADGDRDA